jgi:hypothetical protein
MANAFNLVSEGIIFQELHVVGGTSYNLFPLFVHFMHLTILYFIITIIVKVMLIIPSTMGNHLDDPLGRALFILTHFRALDVIINCFPAYLFASNAYGIHIITPPLIVSFAYEHF